MPDLRYTDTNSSDDSIGRAFGLEGNLYLPLVIAGLSAVGLFAVAAFRLHLSYPVAGAIGGFPLGATVAWVLLLKQGKPSGYDRDWMEHVLGLRHFTRLSCSGRKPS